MLTTLSYLVGIADVYASKSPLLLKDGHLFFTNVPFYAPCMNCKHVLCLYESKKKSVRLTAHMHHCITFYAIS
jgi:hypothetical protein